ncbi:hypothetical protein [Actinoplanes sp. NPDC049265]|uniref:hypothetical protein n=1 Tax=Actinoplanes sp. NPDC049265 TaxID=3363902 RepID=UPI0037114DE3
MTALGRLLAQENTATDLLAYLIELDPHPLAVVLDLPAGEYIAEREIMIGGRNRLDLLIRRHGSLEPMALLELKGASGEHNDQLGRYAAWAATSAPAARLRYCTLDGSAAAEVDGPWCPLSLIDLFGAWRTSLHPHAAWFGSDIADVLKDWDAQADDVIGSVTGWYVPDLITRRIAGALGDHAYALRTKAGNPMLLAYRQHLSGSSDTWIGVDLRCEGRKSPQRPWLFRPFVEVSFDNPTPEAQAAARQLAIAMQPAMMLHAIQQIVKDPDVLSANQHGGLLRYRESEPIFYHDKQVRLATQFKMDVSRVNRHDVAEMIRAVLDHLDHFAARAANTAATSS